MVWKGAGGARAPVGVEEETFARERVLRGGGINARELELVLKAEGAERFAEMQSVGSTALSSGTGTEMFAPLGGDGLFGAAGDSTAMMAMHQDDVDQLWAAFESTS